MTSSKEKSKYPFYSVPVFLWDSPFQNLSSEARLLYGLLLSRTELSRKNNWIAGGKIYVVFTIREVTEKLNCREQKAVKLMKTLEEHGLIVRHREKANAAYRIFLKQPAKITTPDDEIHCSQPLKNTAVADDYHNSQAMKITTYIDRQKIDRTNQIDIDTKNAFGSNQNVFLSDSEFETLKKDFPNDYGERIDKLSNYMSSNNKSYNDHMATIRLWASNENPANKSTKPNYSQVKGVSL